MGGRPTDPRKYQQPFDVTVGYARSVARAAVVKIKKYREPHAVLRYGYEYVIRRITVHYKDHLPSHWENLPWYELVGVYDQRTTIDLISEDIIAAHNSNAATAAESDSLPGRKSK